LGARALQTDRQTTDGQEIAYTERECHKAKRRDQVLKRRLPVNEDNA